MSKNNNIHINTKNVVSRIIGRHSDEAVVRATTSRVSEGLVPGDFAHDMFYAETLSDLFPGARVLGCVGKPRRNGNVLAITRWGNRGLHISLSKGYIQISLLAGEKAAVSVSTHDPVTGESVAADLHPQKMINLKVFGNEFDQNATFALEHLLDSFEDLKVEGASRKDKNGRVKPVWRSTEMTIFIQVADMGVDAQEGFYIVPSCITVLDTREYEVNDPWSRGSALGMFGQNHVSYQKVVKTNDVMDIVNKKPSAVPDQTLVGSADSYPDDVSPI